MTIEERLEENERQLGRQKLRNRWLLIVTFLMAGGLIFPVVFNTMAFRAGAQGAGRTKEIRGNIFVLEDENGKTRARLLTNKEGTGFVLYDESGTTRVGLTVDNKGLPGLLLYGEDGTARGGLVEGADQTTLSVHDKSGNLREPGRGRNQGYF